MREGEVAPSGVCEQVEGLADAGEHAEPRARRPSEMPSASISSLSHSMKRAVVHRGVADRNELRQAALRRARSRRHAVRGDAECRSISRVSFEHAARRVGQVEPGLGDVASRERAALLQPQMVRASAAVTSSESPIALPTSRIAARRDSGSRSRKAGAVRPYVS